MMRPALGHQIIYQREAITRGDWFDFVLAIGVEGSVVDIKFTLLRKVEATANAEADCARTCCPANTKHPRAQI